ncbi:GNAT family N-acetyltransferase [Anaeromyxobacter oryzae]|uniref:GNAT family N-acetyltransferase n=1 Tax=Anaeromyxobacter oryzae TaxID=2918170 RepID=UPI0020C0DAFC|nr:GNAT family N-acetyltransferase [Anaeromyxobacter oryzae]
MRVRTVAAVDLEASLDLFEAVCAEGRWLATEAPIDRAEVRRSWEALLAGGDGTLLLAEEAPGAPPAGLVALVGRARPELGMLVAAGARRRGVGEALLLGALDWARAAGAAEVVLHVFPHNTAALALYRKHGFEDRGLVRRAYPRRSGERWDAHRMVKRLAPAAPR